MAMSELKQELLKYELNKIGFTAAEYSQETDSIKLSPYDEHTPVINGEGDIRYGLVYEKFITDKLIPLVERVNEQAAAWENAHSVPIDNLSHYRLLAEYNGIVLAARDDTKKDGGLYFVTWQYSQDRTGLNMGHYTEDYAAAKEDYAKRAGLIPQAKIFTQEQAAEIKAAVEYRLENDSDFYLTYAKEEALKGIAEQLKEAYPEKKDIMYDSEVRDGIEKSVENKDDIFDELKKSADETGFVYEEVSLNTNSEADDVRTEKPERAEKSSLLGELKERQKEIKPPDSSVKSKDNKIEIGDD